MTRIVTNVTNKFKHKFKEIQYILKIVTRLDLDHLRSDKTKSSKL